MSRVVEFFWDPASPYTYMAATQIEKIAARNGASVQWKPFLLGKAFEATGNKAPATIPAKGKYLFGDLPLWARHYGVPFRFPKVFPINSMLPQRAACAVPEAHMADWAQAVMHAYWAEDKDISQAEQLKAVAASLRLDGEALLAATQDQAVKDKLRANTDEAIKRGAFGAPTFFIGSQMFWGNDRLVLLEEFLQGKFA